MKIKSIGVAVFFALLSSSVLAADLPSHRAAPVFIPAPIPVFSWTGAYIGGQLGYEDGHVSAFEFATADRTGLVDGGAGNRGVIFGAHVGYNLPTQTISAFGGLGTGGVYGIEGDIDGNTARASYSFGAVKGASRDNVEGSLRGRIGLAIDHVLFYVTGGAAVGTINNNYLNTITFTSDSASKTRIGYTVGGGLEYAVTSNWIVRAEYRFTDYGNASTVLVNTTGSTAAVRTRMKDSRVQAGLSYKFDTFAPAPVIARY